MASMARVPPLMMAMLVPLLSTTVSAFVPSMVAGRNPTRTLEGLKGGRPCHGTTPPLAANRVEGGEGEGRESSAEGSSSTRREFCLQSVAAAALAGAVGGGAMLGNPLEASANGLVDYPPLKLNNRYYLMRSGEAFCDEADVIQSHPIDKLSAENDLTDAGIRQCQDMAETLFEGGVMGGVDTIIYHDISSRCIKTAHIVAENLDIGYDRIVPEFSFLEPRGYGALEGSPASVAMAAVHKNDALDETWRPPPNTDGTPHESVQDVFVRGRQLISKLETSYLGADIILVSPDSDNLSVLQSWMLGEPLTDHDKYSIAAGKVRAMRISPSTIPGYKKWKADKENSSAIV